jgi:hypothetical protein
MKRNRRDSAWLKKRVAGDVRATALFAVLGFVFSSGFAGAATAGDARPDGAIGQAGWIDWNGDNFFGPCRGDCALSLYGGKEVTTSMKRIFLVDYPPAPFWKWRWRDNAFVGGTISRRLVTFWGALSLEPEFGIGQRFGGMHATEFWGALNIRWTEFPWNHYIKTSIGLAEGISMTTQVDTEERLLNNYKIVGRHLVFTGSNVLHFFTPEITLALPQYESYELVIRFHHRSGVFGEINGVHAGAQFFTTGFRARF